VARASPRTTGLGSGREGWTAVATLLQRCSGKAEVVASRSGAGSHAGTGCCYHELKSPKPRLGFFLATGTAVLVEGSSSAARFVAAGLMYLPTPWRYVWGPWLPGLGWWVFPVFSGAASSSCVVLRCSAICDGARRRLVRSPAGWAGSPQPLPAWCPPHLSVGLLVGVHKHRGEVDADLLLAAERGK